MSGAFIIRAEGLRWQQAGAESLYDFARRTTSVPEREDWSPYPWSKAAKYETQSPLHPGRLAVDDADTAAFCHKGAEREPKAGIDRRAVANARTVHPLRKPPAKLVFKPKRYDRFVGQIFRPNFGLGG